MSEQEAALTLPTPGWESGVYVLYVPDASWLTAPFVDQMLALWHTRKAGKPGILALPEGLRLEWVGPPPTEPSGD